MSTVASGARPHAAEARVKTTPIENTRRRPYWSPSEPPSSRSAASERVMVRADDHSETGRRPALGGDPVICRDFPSVGSRSPPPSGLHGACGRGDRSKWSGRRTIRPAAVRSAPLQDSPDVRRLAHVLEVVGDHAYDADAHRHRWVPAWVHYPGEVGL